MDNIIEKELIESQAFKMGRRSDCRELVDSYYDTSEERECFCF